ncbi:quinon protein alcohol dehydrogenase-like superfamily [Pilobolus umbonatus]|nr:quinon protein alcohol dehydrogenase-like superfamily [Pilobolus umbonatus]
MNKDKRPIDPLWSEPNNLSDSNKKLCYRHRPDLVQKRGPDDFDTQQCQKQIERLSHSDRETISHIWSLFSAANADQRTLILKGLLSTCCMPQLSFIHNVTKPLLRIDFMLILPKEVSLMIFSYLDAQSLCHAAQVSLSWKKLADDDLLWHKMCEQHIDKKCQKCGWGLPLLNNSRSHGVYKKSLAAIPIRASNISPISERPNRVSNDDILTTHELNRVSRPWKDVYRERLMVERNWRNNKYEVLTLRGHSDGVICVQFCDILKIIITGSSDKSIRVWSLETGRELKTLLGHSRCVRALQFDAVKLVTGAMDNTLKIWNYQTGKCIRTLEGHTGGVLSLHFDSRTLASGSTDHTIRVWNFEAGECCTLIGHRESVNSVRICHEGAMLVSGSDDCCIRLWNLQNKSCIKTYSGHVGQVQVALPSVYGFTHKLNASIISSSTKHSETDNCNMISSYIPSNCSSSNNTDYLSTHAIPTHIRPALSLEDSPIQSDTPIIISSSLDNTIKMWDMSTGKCLRTLFGHVQGVWSLAYDKLRIVSGSHDRTIRVWDTESGRFLYALEEHNAPVIAVALSDTRIVSGSDDGEVKIRNYGIGI